MAWNFKIYQRLEYRRTLEPHLRSVNIRMAIVSIANASTLPSALSGLTTGSQIGKAFGTGAGKSSSATNAGSAGSSGSASKIENVAARLVPFDMGSLGGPLEPIKMSGGLVFQYTPTITETIAVKYADSGDLVHTNESYQVYKGTDNRKISLSNVSFTADTEENARYMLAAIHFFRVYTLMDFGKGKSGKPPSPMWFSAYGKLAFDQIPVLLSGANITWSHEKDYIRVSASIMPGLSNTSSRRAGQADEPTTNSTPGAGAFSKLIPSLGGGLGQKSSGAGGGTSGDYVWVPAKIDIDGIVLTVQHTPSYWKNTFSLKEFYSGGMLEKRENSMPANNPAAARSSSDATPTPQPSSPSSPSSSAAIPRSRSAPLPNMVVPFFPGE